VTEKFESEIEEACEGTQDWLRSLPEWQKHPVSEDRRESGNFGPTILSEDDCILHFARHLNVAGVRWEDMHFELSGSKWIFAPPREGSTGWRVDLALIDRNRLVGADLPDTSGEFQFDAFFEFALGSNYWLFGSPWGAPKKIRDKVGRDVEKVGRYTAHGLCRLGYVVVFEECDHEFPSGFVQQAEGRHPGVRVRLLRRWSQPGKS
jgi:hypothetical protein